MDQQYLSSYSVPTPPLTQPYFTNHPFAPIVSHEMQHFPQLQPTTAIAMDHNTIPQQCHQYTNSNVHNGKLPIYTKLDKKI